MGSPPSSILWVTLLGAAAVGSNVTSVPVSETAVHCVTDGQARVSSAWPAATVHDLLLGVVEVGSNVTSTPPLPTTVHCVADGQAIDDEDPPLCSSAIGVDQLNRS